MKKNRIDNNNNLVDNLLKNDYIHELINQYQDKLIDYDYIETVEQFSLLRLKGSLK